MVQWRLFWKFRNMFDLAIYICIYIYICIIYIYVYVITYILFIYMYMLYVIYIYIFQSHLNMCSINKKIVLKTNLLSKIFRFLYRSFVGIMTYIYMIYLKLVTHLKLAFVLIYNIYICYIYYIHFRFWEICNLKMCDFKICLLSYIFPFLR